MHEARHTVPERGFATGGLAANALAAGETSKVESAYQRIKGLVVSARLKPGEQIHVARLSQRLEIGMTPVREALSRLLAEELIMSVPNRGFFCKSLDVAELRALYEFGSVLLEHSLLASGRADDGLEGGFDRLQSGAERGAKAQRSAEARAQLYAGLVEATFERIATLSRNPVIIESVKRFNDRSHYMRVIDFLAEGEIEQRREEFETLLASLGAGQREAASVQLKSIIAAKLARLPGLAKEGLARAYLPPQPSERSPARRGADATFREG